MNWTARARELCLEAGWCDRCYRPQDYRQPCPYSAKIAALAAEAFRDGQQSQRVPCRLCEKDTADVKWAHCYGCRQRLHDAAVTEGHAAGVKEALEAARAKVSGYTPMSNQAIGVLNAIKALRASQE